MSGPSQDTATAETLHATSVAVGRRAALLMGASGVGKSDLALRLIDRGAMLVSDDYTCCTPRGGLLIAAAPATIVGRMEVRGIGVVAMPHLQNVPVAIAITLGDTAPRMLDDPLPTMMIAGLAIPVATLSAFEPSAAIKVEMLVRAVDRDDL